MRIKLRYRLVVAVVILLAIVPSYVRILRVFGYSDAPSFLLGDRILVNKAAYDIRIPYTRFVFIYHSQPKSGDVVIFRDPGEEYLVFKRIVGCPGDTISMNDNLLTINGQPMLYEEIDPDLDQSIRDENRLGTVVAREIGNGIPHLVTFTPGESGYGTFGPAVVHEGYYFVMGDNRDHSEDSRMYGPIPRKSILGKVAAIAAR